MAMWKNDDEMFALMKEKLYTPVVGDILDQMGYKHQFLPASIRPLAAQVPTAPYILPGEEEDKRLKVAGYACTVLENDVFEYPAEKPFGYMTEALDDLKPNEIYIATGAHNSALWGELLTACGTPCAQPAPSPTATNAAWRTYAGHERNFCMNKTTENRLGGELRSHQAARRLLEELRRGRYADAAQLPSELELADVLGVSRTVVRDALSDLERDGYVERVRGIGTLVNRDVVRVENRMDQKLEFNRMIRSIGRVPHSDNLMVTRETAMPELAAKLGLDPEREHTLVFVRRRVLADETPVLYSTDILPLALFGGKRLDTIDFSRPIFEIVEQHCHVEVTETLTTLHAVQGAPGIRRQLGLRPEQALLQLDEICYSRTCKPVLCCQTCYTDFFDFAMVRKLI